MLFLCLQDRLVADLDHKTNMHEQVQQQLDNDVESLKNLEREAAALISKARHASGKLMVGSSTVGAALPRWTCSSTRSTQPSGGIDVMSATTRDKQPLHLLCTRYSCAC